LRLCAFSGLVKNNQQPRFVGAWDFEWHSLNIYFVASALELNSRSLFPGGFVRLDGVLNRGAQVCYQSRSRKLQEIECRRTGRVFEKQLAPAAELLHVHIFIDYDRRAHIATQDDAAVQV